MAKDRKYSKEFRLQIALTDRGPSAELIHHSNRDVQSEGGDFQDLPEDNKDVCSLSKKSNCRDNTCVESFFGRLKNK